MYVNGEGIIWPLEINGKKSGSFKFIEKQRDL